MLKKRFTELAAVVAITMSAGAAQANIFDNGGFETVDAGNATLAQNWLPAASGYTRVCGGAGNGSDCAAQLNSPQTNAAVFLQDSNGLGGDPLVVGSNPILTFDAKGLPGVSEVDNFALRYLDDIGTILSDSLLQNYGGSINDSSWTQISFDLGVVPAGAVAAFLEISQGIGPFDSAQILIDNVNLEVAQVPVPAAVWLFGSGLLGLIGVARRKKAA
jgi:hypothetical protein